MSLAFQEWPYYQTLCQPKSLAIHSHLLTHLKHQWTRLHDHNGHVKMTNISSPFPQSIKKTGQWESINDRICDSGSFNKKKRFFYSSINNCLLSVLLSWLHTLSISRSLFAKMRVMCYERYPRFHTFWGPWRWRDQLSISQHPCSWLPPARESHRQPERQIQSEREKKDKEKRSQEVLKKDLIN